MQTTESKVFKRDEMININGEEFYSSEKVDKLLYLRDLFARNGIFIEDFEVFEKIAEGLETYEMLKNV